MKLATKSTVACLVIGLGAAIGIGANFDSGERPAHVTAENWIPMGDKAGVAVGSPSSDNRVINVQLYVKTKEGWRQSRVTNDAVFERVKP